MKVTPRTEEEVKRIFDKGTYRFRVESAKERMSAAKEGKPSKPMIELDLTIYHNVIKYKTSRAKCFLMPSDSNFEFLVRHFCYSVGLQDDYNSGEIESKRIIGKEGIALVGIEIDKNGTYPDKNRILDFLFDEINDNKNTIPKDLNDSLDDIAF